MTCNLAGCEKNVVSKGLCDKHRKRLARHGHTDQTRPERWGESEKHPLYKLWCGIRRRCTDVNCRSYMDYGGRGIKVDPSWDNFWIFASDMGDRPSHKHQIDRINNDKGYSKENCRWVLPKEQQRNRRNNALSVGLAAEIRRRYQFGDRMCDISKSLGVAYHNVENVIRKPEIWR